MEGRWNVLPDSERNGTWIALDPDKNIGMPVVPCDDAAIERAARSIMRSFKDAVAQSDSAGSGELDFRDVARRAFRAAGETP